MSSVPLKIAGAIFVAAFACACTPSAPQQQNSSQTPAVATGQNTAKLQSSAVASLGEESVKQLLRQLDACVGDDSCTSSDAIMEELWRRGYCTTDARGTIQKCTPQEVKEDRISSALLDLDIASPAEKQRIVEKLRSYDICPDSSGGFDNAVYCDSGKPYFSE